MASSHCERFSTLTGLCAPFTNRYLIFKASFSIASVCRLYAAFCTFKCVLSGFPKAKTRNLRQHDATRTFYHSLFGLSEAITSLDYLYVFTKIKAVWWYVFMCYCLHTMNLNWLIKSHLMHHRLVATNGYNSGFTRILLRLDEKYFQSRLLKARTTPLSPSKHLAVK